MLLVVPVYSTFWIASSTLAGLIYFQEFHVIASNSTHLALFLCGTLLALAGVFVLARDASDSETKRAESADAPADAYGSANGDADAAIC